MNIMHGMHEKTPSPVTRADIERLLEFAPRLRALAQARDSLGTLRGGGRLRSGAIEGFWVEYPPEVADFFEAAGRDPWNDYGYSPKAAGKMIAEPGRIANASLDEVRTMLTWCTRGERFCDGHWAAVIGDGKVLGLLDRLQALYDGMAAV